MEAMTEKLSNREAKSSEPDLKIQLLVEEAGRTGNLQKRLDPKSGALESAKREFESR